MKTLVPSHLVPADNPMITDQVWIDAASKYFRGCVDERVKALAAQALEHVGAAAVVAVPDLVHLLEDPSEGLRNSACIGLAGIGPTARDALPALRRALADPSNDVRRFAQRAIDRIAQKLDHESENARQTSRCTRRPRVKCVERPLVNAKS